MSRSIGTRRTTPKDGAVHAAQHLIEFIGQFARIGVVGRKQRKRHPFQPVDVEQGDIVAQGFALLGRSFDDHEISRRIGVQQP